MLSLFIQQGVNKDIAAAYLEHLPSDEATLPELLDIQELDGGAKEKRLMRRLQGRGYTYGLIQTSIRQVKEENAR